MPEAWISVQASHEGGKCLSLPCRLPGPPLTGPPPPGSWASPPRASTDRELALEAETETRYSDMGCRHPHNVLTRVQNVQPSLSSHSIFHKLSKVPMYYRYNSIIRNEIQKYFPLLCQLMKSLAFLVSY